MESLHQRLGSHAMVKDLVNLDAEDVLQYDPNQDKMLNVNKFPILDKKPEVTQEWRNQYVNAEILLPRGDRMARGKVVHQKHDANGNLIVRSNQNPILDTCLYEVGGEITD